MSRMTLAGMLAMTAALVPTGSYPFMDDPTRSLRRAERHLSLEQDIERAKARIAAAQAKQARKAQRRIKEKLERIAKGKER